MNAADRRLHRRIVTAAFGEASKEEAEAGARALVATARCLRFDKRGGWEGSRKGRRLLERLHATLGGMPETEWTLQVLDHAIRATGGSQ